MRGEEGKFRRDEMNAGRGRPSGRTARRGARLFQVIHRCADQFAVSSAIALGFLAEQRRVTPVRGLLARVGESLNHAYPLAA